MAGCVLVRLARAGTPGPVEGTHRITASKFGVPMTPKELRSRRMANGISVETLARVLGVSAEVLRAMENGEQPLPQDADLERAFAQVRKSET